MFHSPSPASHIQTRFLAVMPLTVAEEQTFNAGNDWSEAAPALGHGARSYLGRRLRQNYQPIVDLPLPETLLNLLQQIDKNSHHSGAHITH